MMKMMGDAKGVQAMEDREDGVEQETAAHKTTKEIADVLVIVTGGTLSMVQTDMGYMTAKQLYKRLKKIQ